MIPVSRRNLLSRLAFGATFLPALLHAPRSIIGSLLFEPDGELVAAKPVPVNPYQQDGKAVVAMVYGTDVDVMLTAGLRLIGGLTRLNLKDKRVLIKPNVVNDRPPPTTTNPQVVSAIVRAVREAGARDILVADSSGIIRFPTSSNLVTTGIKQAAESHGARVLALEDEPWVRVEPPAAKILPRYYISRPVYEADVFINVPVIKTHKFAHYSCSLKNLVGITHPRYRPSVAFISPDWDERIAELNLAVHPHLTIADGTTVMIAGGPTSGESAPGNLLLLSGDRIALDVLAVAFLRTYGTWPKLTGKKVWEQRQIARAIELGLGIQDARHLHLLPLSVAGPNSRFEELTAKIRMDIEA
jgi:uncharacterized protein (DUF362 family)